MLNLSIMPLDAENIDAVCEDVIAQQRDGVSTHAMFMMKFQPEGTPPVDKASKQCEIYDRYKKKLDPVGAKHGVLVQATLGHIVVPYEPYPFQPSVSLLTGEPNVITACPLDPEFRKFMRGQMKILASRHPSVVMVDDDLGLLYRAWKGCACKYHLAELNKRAGTNLVREDVYRHTQGVSDEDKRITGIYVDVIRDSIVGFVKELRAGLDEVDPTIQGVVSGIYTSTYLEFSDETAVAFAGKGNPAIARLNGGPYAKLGTKNFTAPMYRAAIIRENAKGKIDKFLAETDTCPQNRYSTSASHLHAHFTASILEGATGAKHWITRLAAHEPDSGKAYRKKLKKYSAFYERLCEYKENLEPFGCKIPLSLMQNYGFVEAEQPLNLAPWASCVLERMGIPFYYGNSGEATAFLDDLSVDGFSDDEIRGFLKYRLVLSAVAAKKLCDRGFADDIGVTSRKWNGAVINGECVYGKHMSAQYGVKELVELRDGVKWLSEVYHKDGGSGCETALFPGVTSFKNTEGGETIVFSGNPDMPFKYYTAFSMLNETRKRQLVDVLSENGGLPLYYPEDAEVYIRAGRLPEGRVLAAIFNLGFDDLEEIPLRVNFPVNKVSRLDENGEERECKFSLEDGLLTVYEPADTLDPTVLILS